MIIGVTGGSSAIGQAVAERIRSVGATPRFLGRSVTGPDHVAFELGKPPKTEAFEGMAALIHLAWDWSADPDQSYVTNVGGAAQLEEICRAHGTTPILLSTVSVTARESSTYGSQKAMVEEMFINGGGYAIRSGLIWDPKSTPAGMVQTVLKLAKIPGICTHLKPDPWMTYSDVEHLVGALVGAARGDVPPASCTVAASAEPVRLSEISHAARSGGKNGMHVRISPKALLAVATKAQSAGISLPFRVDSLNAVLSDADPYDRANGIALLEGFLGKDQFLQWIAAVSEAGRARS